MSQKLRSMKYREFMKMFERAGHEVDGETVIGPSGTRRYPRVGTEVPVSYVRDAMRFFDLSREFVLGSG